MSSTKRKALNTLLQRRVRPRREASEELAFEEFEEEVAAQSEGDSEGSEESGSEENGSSLDSESEAEAPDASSISFGALVKAQASLEPSARKKTSVKKDEDAWEDYEAKERKEGRKDHRDFGRSSKHAPTEISSKKAVSRKREVVVVAKRQVRDPRFEPLVNGAGAVGTGNTNKAYAFLDDYREDEMRELREGIKKEKDEGKKEIMKRALHSMESRKKAQARKNKEQELLDKHRQEEKELVRQGKKPFYLKKAEQKKRLLEDQFAGLKGKQLDRVIERRRKKVEGKEKKKMPFARREFE